MQEQKNRKVALVTGASDGLGSGLAAIHAERGGDLVLVARRKECLEELARKLSSSHGAKCAIIAMDLAREGAAQELFDKVKEMGI